MKVYFVVKRLADVFFSITLIILLTPFFILIGLLIKCDSPGPVFFLQTRLGRSNKTFRLVKFRTMVDGAENLGTGIITDEIDRRITRVGRLLRKASIDELPQLFNIVKGEMSFIGPRPAPPLLLKQYDVGNAARLSIRPGITGWAQVNGRNDLTWPQKIDKDIWYVNNLSLFLDLRIAVMTVWTVFLFKGIYSGRFREEVKAMNKEGW